jgi:L-aminopeptidase/D-esterase-like protein
MIDYNASTLGLASRLWKRLSPESPEALRRALRAAGDQQLDRGPVGAGCGDSCGESEGDSGFSEAGEA